MALHLDPYHTGARNNLGNILKRQARHGEAYQAYREALIIDPLHTGPKKHSRCVGAIGRGGKGGQGVR